MGIRYIDKVRETTTSIGVGPIFLLDGPVAKGGYRGFVDKVGNGQECAVRIENPDYNEWAVFAARVIQGTPDSLDCYYLSSSSNNDALVNFQPGEKTVDCIFAGEDIAQISRLSKMEVIGGGLDYDATFGFILRAGECAIQGFRVSWSDINGPGPSGHTVSKMHYAYVHDDDGDAIAQLEFNDTAPEYNSVDGYLQKTADPSRRLVGAVLVNAAGAIPSFQSEKRGGRVVMVYDTPTADASIFSGQVPLTWTEILTLTNFVPIGALSINLRTAITMPNQNNFQTIGFESRNVAKSINDAASLISVTAPRAAFSQITDVSNILTDWQSPRLFIIGDESGTNVTDIYVRGWQMDV